VTRIGWWKSESVEEATMCHPSEVPKPSVMWATVNRMWCQTWQLRRKPKDISQNPSKCNSACGLNYYTWS
jgi:hypothetical protein